MKNVPNTWKARMIFEKTDPGTFNLLESIYGAVSIFFIQIRYKRRFNLNLVRLINDVSKHESKHACFW